MKSKLITSLLIFPSIWSTTDKNHHVVVKNYSIRILVYLQIVFKHSTDVYWITERTLRKCSGVGKYFSKSFCYHDTLSGYQSSVVFFLKDPCHCQREFNSYPFILMSLKLKKKKKLTRLPANPKDSLCRPLLRNRVRPFIFEMH